MPLVTAEQTRADLEELYASLSKGWTCIGDGVHTSTRLFGAALQQDHTTALRYIQYGCLFHQMYWITEHRAFTPHDALYNTPGDRRRMAMVTALGFGTSQQMYAWNDDPNRTWDEVKDRVKDAIGRL
jgi:hypothetical protein